MKPQSREELKQYALRKLGYPVLKINVANEQLEDLIDDALQFFSEYHFDGSESTFLTHQITSEDMENQYIPVYDDISFIVNVFPFSLSGNTNGSVFFNIEYQMRLNDWDMFNRAFGGVQYYDHLQRWLSLVRDTLHGKPSMRFNRLTNKLYLDVNWDTTFSVTPAKMEVSDASGFSVAAIGSIPTRY